MSVSACMCVRQYEYHSTLPHLLPPMYDFMIDLLKKRNTYHHHCIYLLYTSSK